MIISAVGRFVVLLQIFDPGARNALADSSSSSSSLRGSVVIGNGIGSDSSLSSVLLEGHPDANHDDHRSPPHRILQTTTNCSSITKNNQCPTTGTNPPCAWIQGGCVPAPTPPPATPRPTNNPTTPRPTSPPTYAPTSPPTSGPTSGPTAEGAGHCSDDGARQCFSTADCVCGGAAASASARSDESFFERRLRRATDAMITGQDDRHRHLAKPQCNDGSCRMACGSCAIDNRLDGSPCCAAPVTSDPTRSPTRMPTLPPVKGNPTEAPTHCACLGLGPTKSPTPEPSNSPTNPPTNRPTNPPTLQPTDAPTKLTNPPTIAPTNLPSHSPSKAPINSSVYGTGPFVTTATSSEIVNIPRPPVPPPSSGSPRTGCPHEEVGLLSWHDVATWTSSHGYIPLAGESVTLPSNSKVLISQTVLEELGVVTVPSTSELIFDENAVSPIAFDVAGMDVRGALRAGSETCPYQTEVVITLHGTRPNDFDNFGVSPTATKTYKGISVDGGIISLHGKRHYPTWTRLAESVPIGQDYILLQERVNWEVGQEIVLVTTAIHDSKNWHRNEVHTITSVVDDPVPGVVGSAMHLSSPVTYAHIANGGYQGEVGLLSRNIKIQGAANDSEPTDPDPLTCTSSGIWHFSTNFQPCPNTDTTGFGGHIMVHSGGKGYLEGVELYRMGQTNVLGRYPFHWHLLGNSCPDCYFRSNSVHRSFYRCVSIHGTHNATVSENVAYDVTGYCYYLEDGVEEDNTISYNLAAHVHPVSNILANSGGGQSIDVFSQSRNLILPADVTASGYYLTNLANTIVGNAASGGWAGFALPILHTPIGPNRNVNMRPGNRLTKVFDGNTAHSTGWWWSHAGAFYSGGSLYYSDADPTLLEYNAGRDQIKGSRSPCLVDKCVTNNDCNSYCYEGERAWFRLTNNKVFLTPSPGLNSWSGRMEIIHFETHDVALGLEALESGFGISNLLVECRSGEEWVMPGTPAGATANGFFWYDTGQEHIITSATFRNCGARSGSNYYDTSPTRGCDNNSYNGCNTGSSVWGFLTHSDQFTPELMQATSGIAYENCGRRFKLADYADNNVISSVSGRQQNWVDADGTASGLNEPTIIGSGLADAGHWWRVEDDVVEDPEGPLTFIKVGNGPERGLGHIRFRFKDEIHNTVGSTSCLNGPKVDGFGNPYCPPIGRIRHIGPLFDITQDPIGGLPITANSEVAGPVGGFGWVLQLDDGPPKNLKIDQVEVDSTTPLILAIPYPTGTSFAITAHAAWCSATNTNSCTEQFQAVNSVAHVRHSQGNTYFYDTNTEMLYIRIIQTPESYTGDTLYSPTPKWHIWDLDDLNTVPWQPRLHALDRFTFDGITLPKFAYGNYLQVTADCAEGVTGHCATAPSYVEPQVCPSGYVQVSYDKCCVSPGSTDCYVSTPPPSTSPTMAPTFGIDSNRVLNPGFEDGLTNWYANSGTIEIDTTEYHSGTQSVLCKSRTATWQGAQQNMMGRLDPNATYRISVWAKLKGTAVASSFFKLTLRIEDDTGTKWPGVTATINNNGWTLVEGVLTVSVTGTMTAVYLYAEGPAVGVEFLVDDFSAVLVQ